MAVTHRQIKELAPYLEGDKPTHINTDEETGEQTREWNLVCPLHEDERRSASINVDKGLFYCFKCGGMPVTALIRRKSEWHGPTNINGHKPNLNGTAHVRPKLTLTDGLIAGWHSALMSNKGALQWLRERRGLTPDTLERFEIGWKDNRVYTIPVRSPEGEIWNVRYYNPDPRGGARKIWSEEGYGSPPRLYPINLLNVYEEYALILAGEWDTLLAIQYGFNAVTRTAGENKWDSAWCSYFKNLKTYIMQDADEEGVQANKRIARAMLPVAPRTFILDLPYPVTKKHGPDATDLLLDHGPEKLREMIAQAVPLSKRGRPEPVTEGVETVTVLDTFDARRVGDPVRVIVTVKGRKEPGYSVPKKVHLVCSQDAGPKCAICPMNAVSGEANVNFDPDDPIMLAMIDSKQEQLHQIVADSYGVPGGRCGRLVQEVEEHQAVEVLFGRPALDYSDGSDLSPDAATYKNIRITNAGRHDTAANNTVAFTGALQPNPRSQANEFLAHQIEQMETSVDRFELTKESIALMKRFQARPGKPLRKLAEIDAALAEHVTKIQGRPEMHALMDLTFHSILSFRFGGEIVHRGWLDTLIIGDTQTGKSTAARALIGHYRAGEIINCESATFAGVIGGVQQLGGKDWLVTWGIVPINDRRLVVMEEVSGLSTDEIASMSDVRSSGQAKLVKVQQDTTWSRTRLLWMGNPRNARMSNFTYGVDAIRPLIGTDEDIARFDLAMAVTMFDVPSEDINQPYEPGELRYTSDACHTLLMWCWTRSADQVVWDKGAEQRVFERANEMGKQYVEDPPLVQAANIRIKITRIAVALAARLFSTDDTYENVVVKAEHVDAAVEFINRLYGMTVFGYRERSRQQLLDREEAESKKAEMKQYLMGRPMLAKYLLTTGKFRRQDLEEIMSNVSREEANAIISTLYEARMVRKDKGDIVVQPTLHALLREVKW